MTIHKCQGTKWGKPEYQCEHQPTHKIGRLWYCSTHAWQGHNRRWQERKIFRDTVTILVVSILSFILGVVTSDPFRMKRAVPETLEPTEADGQNQP